VVRIGSGTPSNGPAHCSICHWLRSLRPLVGDLVEVAAAIVPADALPPDPLTHEGHRTLVRVPARSPPA
jgi:hypothetical protein